MREDRSKLSWVGIGIVALVAILALLLYGLLASSAVVSLFTFSAFDAGFYLCLAIGFFTVLNIANYLTELHRVDCGSGFVDDPAISLVKSEADSNFLPELARGRH
jgi:hypothetical protein